MLNSKNLEHIEKACVSKEIDMGAEYIFRPNDTYKDKKGVPQTQPSCCIDSGGYSHSLERIKCMDDTSGPGGQGTGYCLYCANAGPGPNCYADIDPESINSH